MTVAIKDDHLENPVDQSETIVVASCSLNELLAGNAITGSNNSQILGRLTLPEYQRPYRWGEKELTRLLNDLQVYFAAGGEAETGHDFYLGSIILHQTEQGDQPVLNIIDGQQRLTTMALLAYCLNQQGDRLEILPEGELEFQAPESQNTIFRNLKWLKEQTLPALDFEQINITLVVTRSEDDAYRFFETQNTGGVRLSGPDIIKAHHLRAVPRNQQNRYAKQWEAMGDLLPLVDAMMKSRHWQTLKFRKLASHRQPPKVRDEIVNELAEQTGTGKVDLAYRQSCFQHTSDGWLQELAAKGYAMRQPLNAGVNTIHYLEYFNGLQQTLLVQKDNPDLEEFYLIYEELAEKAKGSAYLKKLYDSTLLLYVSQFGCQRLLEASLWLFRVVYSPRLSNQRNVREDSVEKFVRADASVLDWIATSFSHDELMAYLRGFQYKADPNNLDGRKAKNLFVKAVKTALNMKLPKDKRERAEAYDKALVKAIESRVAETMQKDVL